MTTLTIFQSVLDWLQAHELPCPYKRLTGFDCPGCGMQRSFIELLRGNLHQSFALYPALIPILVMMAFLIIQARFKFNRGAAVLKVLFIFNVLIIIVSYIYKLIH